MYYFKIIDGLFLGLEAVPVYHGGLGITKLQLLNLKN
jgi:hypothetical protein